MTNLAIIARLGTGDSLSAIPQFRNSKSAMIRPRLSLLVLFLTGCSTSSLLDNSPSATFDRFVDSYFAGNYRERQVADSAQPFPWLQGDADQRRAVGATNALRDLRAIDTVALELEKRIEWLQLEATLKRAIRDTVLREAQRVPGRYLTVGSLYWQVAGDRRPTGREWQTILKTVQDAPKAIDLGKRQLVDPPSLWVGLARNTADRYEAFLRGEFPEQVRAKAPDSLKSELVLHGEKAADAIRIFKGFLNSLNSGTENSWSVGKDHYNWLLSEVHFLPYDADEMIAVGRRAHAETKAALEHLARGVDPKKSWKALVEEMKGRHPEPGTIAEAYRRESDRARELIVSRQLVSIPQPETLLFVPTPPALRETYAWAGYGGIEVRDEVPAGRFFVTDVVPEMTVEEQEQKLRAQNNGWVTVIALHEGYPGHHLQSLYSRNNPSKVRSRLGNTYFGEGWGLYCEAWMACEGFYKNADDSLAWLQMRLWRTARVIIDPSIHTGQMTYQEAVSFFVDEVGLERSAAEAEVNRYTTWPTQAPSYIIGWLELERLREILKKSRGARFSDREFAETILGIGSLPLELLKRAVLARFTPKEAR
ncbi:MAG: DUF885 domain-containing protein [Bacteroidota bacterium]